MTQPKDGDGKGPRDGARAEGERAHLPANTELAGRYQVIRRLGSGGMGAVYEVRDLQLEEDIALKMLHIALSSDNEYRQRLRAEVRLARRVSHPNVCRVHDLGEHKGQLFVTMELIRGVSLRSKLTAVRRRTCPPLPIARRVDIVVQICSALAAAHRAGVLHRDVKPDNVVLEHERAVLTDFGVASLTAELAASRRLVAGTPAYIAPEMLRGERYDQRADVYASAVVAYELLCGRQPFPTPNLEAAVQRARTQPIPPALPTQCATPQAREALDLVLAKALCFAADERYRTVDRLAEAFAQAARGEFTETWTPPPSDVAVAAADTVPPSTLAPDQPTITMSAPSVQITPPPPVTPSHLPSGSTDTPTTTTRAQVRVATALHFECASDAAPSSETEVLPDDWLDTRPIDLAHEGEKLERTVVDLGGTPLMVSSFSITALFGAPAALGDDAARAARAAHALLQNTRDGRAGIDTARVLYRRGIDGPTASGEAISRAEALAQSAAPGEVRASPAAARQLVGRFQVCKIPITSPDLAKPDLGRALLVEATDLDDEEPIGEGKPLLGRDAELAKLEQLVKMVCEERRPRRAVVLGPAGFGKSALRRELIRRVNERREVEWLLGRATPLGEVAPLSLLRSANPQWFATAAQKGMHDRPAAFAAARRWLERRAARRPVVVTIEDAQWSDDASLEFFEEVWPALDSVPVALLIFGRSAPTAAAVTAEVATDQPVVVQLGPVPDATALQIAKRVAPAASPEELRDLVHRAGGNPFFVEELARDQRERGTTTTLHSTPLPATVEAAVQGRLDRLPPTARELACAAAVVGREFWREAARSALADPQMLSDAELDGILAELEHRSIVNALPPTALDDERYVFRSALVRDVAYQQLAPRDRRRAHAAVAQWLEPRASTSTATFARRGAGADPTTLAAIAMHKDLAGDVVGARDAYRAAGERSLGMFAYREAANALTRARELTADPDADLLEMVGDALTNCETIEASEKAYLSALELTNDTHPGDLVRKARLCHKLDNCAVKRSDNQTAIDWCCRGLEYLLVPAEDAPGKAADRAEPPPYAELLDRELTPAARTNPAVAAALYGSLGWVLGYVLTDNEVGLPFGERGVALLEDTPHRSELAHALGRLGANYMRAGRWRDQLDCNRRNLQIAEELANLEMQLTAHINLGVVYLSLGEIEKSIEHTRRALALGQRTHSTTTIALVRSNLAGCLLELGAPAAEDAETNVQEAIACAERIGFRRVLPESYGFAARLRALRGDLSGAEEMARRAVAITKDAGLVLDEGIASRILAAILIRRGDLRAAEPLLERSRECLTDSDDYEAAKTTAATARFLRARGGEGDESRSRELRAAAEAIFLRLDAKRDLETLDDPGDIR